jgi:hypothetical protein
LRGLSEVPGFDVEAALNGLAALVSTIPAMESVQVGAPESLSARISAWVTAGDPGEIAPRVTGVYDLPMNLIVWFGYVVEGSEQAAEAQLADWITELARRMIQNRFQSVAGNAVTVTSNLNGSVSRMDLPQAAAGVADYTMMAGQESRTYPLAVRVVQTENLGP